MTRIVIIDDHVVVRKGLVALLALEDGLKVVGDAGDARSSLDLIDATKPDLVVLDIALPELNGVDTTRKILKAHPRLKVVALTIYNDRQYVLDMFEAGAVGYVPKEVAPEELLHAIRAVMAGRLYLSPLVTDVIIEEAVGKRAGPVRRSPALTAREREVLQLISEGKTSGEIAALMEVSVATVETHRRNIVKKTGLRSIAEQTKYAIRAGLTSLEM